MELGTDALNGFVHRAATDFAPIDLAGTAVNHFLPLCFGVSIVLRVKAGNELASQVGPVLLWQCQHLGDFFSSNAHTL